MRVNDVWQTPMEHHSDIPVRAPIRVIIFDSTKMGCQLLTRALESSPYKVSVVATYDDSTIASGMTLCDADIGLICVSVGNGQREPTEAATGNSTDQTFHSLCDVA